MESVAPSPDENELLRRVAGGDQDAFAQIYDLYSGVLFATALRILRDAKDAEDTLQDVFLQIWKRAGDFNPALGRPLTWILVMTRRKAIDRRRAAQRRSEKSAQAQTEAELGRPPEEFQPPADLDDRARIVRQALEELPSEQRQAVEMAFFNGLTQSEIAEALGEPLGTVKARIRRGMLKLRAAIEPLL